MCLTGGLLCCEWCRVSLVFNRCVDLFLGSKLSVVSCCNGCAVVNGKSFSVLGVVLAGDSCGCWCVKGCSTKNASKINEYTFLRFYDTYE